MESSPEWAVQRRSLTVYSLLVRKGKLMITIQMFDVKFKLIHSWYLHTVTQATMCIIVNNEFSVLLPLGQFSSSSRSAQRWGSKIFLIDVSDVFNCCFYDTCRGKATNLYCIYLYFMLMCHALNTFILSLSLLIFHYPLRSTSNATVCALAGFCCCCNRHIYYSYSAKWATWAIFHACTRQRQSTVFTEAHGWWQPFCHACVCKF